MNLRTFFINNKAELMAKIGNLAGKKTYLAAVAAAGINCLIAFGVFEPTVEQLLAIEGLIAAAFAVTIRLGIDKK